MVRASGGDALMALLPRRSPKLSVGYDKQDVRDAIETLEDRPRLPLKTPSGTADDGYAGEVCYDASYIYVYISGTGWKRAALSAF